MYGPGRTIRLCVRILYFGENMTKKTPSSVWLQVTVIHHPSGERIENQELFTSGKKAKEKSSAFAKIWSSKDGAQVYGSVRSGRIQIEHDGSVYGLVLSHITDAPIVEMLWKFWNEKEKAQ